MDIAAWLDGLGLGQYEQSFRDNEIDERVLSSLTAEDLKDLGVNLVGHRRRLLDAIAALGAPAGVVAATAGTDHVAPRSDAERRQLTVMFCDLVGSTALSARLDPEDLREVIGAYHKCVAETIGRFDGFVAKYMGDGVLVYFGYPQAHEDDAERAIRAGLAIVQAVRRVSNQEPLQARVGLATGLAVVGDLIGSGAAEEQAVIGETPNLAARLQTLAGPDEIVIPENTRRLVGNLFEYEDLGDIEVKGLAAPVTAFRVLRESGIGSRFEALRTGETPLIGRDEELELLHRRWTQAKAGRGQVVLISAEPGIGKSRLAEAFRQSLEGEPHTRLRYFCSPHHQDSALFPFIAQLERAAEFERGDTPSIRLEKLETLVAANTPEHGDVPLLAELLSVPFEDRYSSLDLTPQRKKEKTFEALLRQLGGLATRQPVLMIFEDLHWADPSSRELLDLTVEQIGRLPVLLVATFRPEFQPPWIGQPHVTTVSLRHLGREESIELIYGLLGRGEALSGEVMVEIAERTDGVPLFIEELTKAVLEAKGCGVSDGSSTAASIPPTSLAVPATLHASLMARLDRLGAAAKEIAQVGAAIGREFSYELLAVIAQRTEAELREAVGRLVDAGLVFQRGQPPQATFVFKHALVQDAAHSTLLRSRRQQIHARIAEIIENKFPEIAASHPELLARHLTEAGLIEKAARFWGEAGQRSLSRSALIEAAEQLRRALSQIAALPSTPALRREQIKLQIGLANAQMQTKGYAAPDTKASLHEARLLIEAAEAQGELAEDKLVLFSVLYGFWVANLVAFNGDALRELAAEFLAIAKDQKATVPLMIGHRLVGTSSVLTGDLAEGRAHLDRAIALYVPKEHRSLATRFATDVRGNILASRSVALCALGYPDAARTDAAHALEDAREIGHSPTLMVALFWGTLIHVHCRDYATANAQLDELVALADTKGSLFWKALGMTIQGCVFTLAGQPLDGIALIGSSIAAYRSTGSSHWMPLCLSILATAYAQLDQFDGAWRCIDEAIVAVKTTREKWIEADIYRMAGEIALMPPEPDAAKAESYFRRALEIARGQQARFWELRAATSLARLWAGEGKRAAARDQLAPVHAWFTEGFDTPDLKEAKALLDELG